MEQIASLINPGVDLLLRIVGTAVGGFGLFVIGDVWWKKQKMTKNAKWYGFAAALVTVAGITSGALLKFGNLEIRLNEAQKKNVQLTTSVAALKNKSASGETAAKLLKAMTGYSYTGKDIVPSALAWSANSAPLNTKALNLLGIKVNPAIRVEDFTSNTVVFKLFNTPLGGTMLNEPNKAVLNAWGKDAGVKVQFLHINKLE